MTDIVSIVTNSLKYYDNNTDIYKDKLKNAYYYKLHNLFSDNEHHIVEFYDENKNLLLKSRFEVIGIYAHMTNTWVWGWSIPILDKVSTKIIRKVFNYGAELDKSEIFLKTELISARFIISDPIQLDIHLAIVSYLSKNPFIYKIYDSDINDIDENGYHKITGLEEYVERPIRYIFLLDHK
jgi:hypothetical protein